eukprot:6350444-Karenia_brevis.AAC.1
MCIRDRTLTDPINRKAFEVQLFQHEESVNQEDVENPGRRRKSGGKVAADTAIGGVSADVLQLEKNMGVFWP